MALPSRMPPPKPMGAITVAFGKKMGGEDPLEEAAGGDGKEDGGEIPAMLGQMRELCDRIEAKVMEQHMPDEGHEEEPGEDDGEGMTGRYPTT